MKKISMILVAAAMVAIVACNEKKADTTDGATTVENTTTTGSPSVDKYLSIVEEAIPLLEKMKAGDAAATEKYTKMAQELSDLASSSTLQAELSNPEVAKKFQDAMQKFSAAAMK